MQNIMSMQILLEVTISSNFEFVFHNYIKSIIILLRFFLCLIHSTQIFIVGERSLCVPVNSRSKDNIKAFRIVIRDLISRHCIIPSITSPYQIQS
jgi:hypothetical protein